MDRFKKEITMIIETTIDDLAQDYDYYMLNRERWLNSNTSEKHNHGIAEGFTIGRGKVMFWYIIVSPMGFYYVYPIDDKHWRRQIEIGTKVKIHYNQTDEDGNSI